MKTVKHFVRGEKKRFVSSKNDAVRAFLPHYAVVPFRLAAKPDYDCTVKENDTVSEGQVIALKMNEGGFTSTYVHAPVPGRVVAFEQCSLPDGRQGIGIKIKTEGSFTYLGKHLKEGDWKWTPPEDLLASLADKGILNTFFKKTPFHTQLAQCAVKKGRFLVVRMFDPDPSYATDSFVAHKYTTQVTNGALIAARAMKAQGIIFAVPKKNAPNLQLENLTTLPCYTIEIDDSQYPCGFMQNLIQAVKKAPKTQEEQFFGDVNHHSIFVDPQTLFAVYEAVVFGKPVLETFVHVTGTCLSNTALFKVRLGTSIESLALQCGGLRSKPAKIIINGMVTGFAVTDGATAITKDVKSVAFVPQSELGDQQFAPCIRCGKCRHICPEGIFPDLMFRHSLGGKPIGLDLQATADLCSNCALCNSVCPSRLPLCQTIELMRKQNNEFQNE